MQPVYFGFEPFARSGIRTTRLQLGVMVLKEL
jgi:hypothetical protein